MINYFFYKDFMFNKLIKHSDPLVVSAIMMSLIEFANAFTFFIILDTQLLHLRSSTPITMTCMIIIGVILMFLNACYFRKNKKRICNKYKDESLIKNILGYIFYVGYLIGSFILPLLLMR